MDEQTAWDQFRQTGSVTSYLQYCAVKKAPLEPTACQEYPEMNSGYPAVQGKPHRADDSDCLP